ncbi:hypothetical protein IGI04_025871 [Brassica rapa subsp. trilocularis]|uniref:Uncharacterized protein n=1 Tax=Brassica rapa subsp. trilocularis TaxID=1813537 RepID=A0ABQ7KXH0_BRACM|nr:hypothetical protein IGI04_025871 [Brassica rapa subsp. trilocularis]
MYFLIIYLFCKFLIKWYSSSTNLKVFQIWKTSGTTYLLVVWKSSGSRLDFLEVVWTSWKSSGLLGSLLTKSSGLPGSRLDFQEVDWTSRKSYGLSGSRLDFQEVRRLPGSHLDFQEVRRLPGSHLDFMEVDLLFLDMFFRSGFNMQVFHIWKTSGTSYLLLTKSSGLPRSRLDFLKVVWTSCKVVWKSSELPKSLLTKSSELPGSRLDFLKVVWTSWKSSDKVFFHIKWSPSLRLIIQSSTRRLKCKSSRIYEV